tara:strand:+ start:19340 stop:20092 length:753 start_codon:yes stop_codon:yes gene_type:complete
VNSTSNNTNTNNSTVDQTVNSTSNNTNNTTSNNTNINKSESTSDSNVTTNNTNNNRNENINKNENKTEQTIKQEIKSPPPSAIAPSIGASFSQDLCTTGISGAVQTQVFGIAGGRSIRDENCERIKLSKTVYDMGMKVAAVSLMCQDERVFQAMEMAGTPCPYEGKIGEEAKVAWTENVWERPDYEEHQAKLDERVSRAQQAEQAIVNQKKAERKAWIKSCKRTKHTEGKHKGVNKSGATCAKEWNTLQS